MKTEALVEESGNGSYISMKTVSFTPDLRSFCHRYPLEEN